jgi:hypothetical protein
MKCTELAIMLEKLVRLGAGPDAAAGPEQLLQLQNLLKSSSDKPVAQLVKELSKIDELATATLSDASLFKAIQLLDEVNSFAETYAKPAITKDVAALGAALQRFQNTDVSTLLLALRAKSTTKSKAAPAPPRPDVIRAWHKRFEEALGDDQGFLRIHGELQQDKSVTAAEVAAIAKAFAYASAKSRPSALKKILARHTNLMVSRAKEAATGGRIAG